MKLSTAPQAARKAWLVILGIAVATVVLLAVSANRSPLVWYVSPPLDRLGRRAKLLVPRGWELDAKETHLSRDALLPDERTTLLFRAPRSTIPRWLQRALRFRDDSKSVAAVDVGRDVQTLGFDAAAPADGNEFTESPSFWNSGLHVSSRILATRSPRLVGIVSFGSPDKDVFDQIHSTICNSFRLE